MGKKITYHQQIVGVVFFPQMESSLIRAELTGKLELTLDDHKFFGHIQIGRNEPFKVNGQILLEDGSLIASAKEKEDLTSIFFQQTSWGSCWGVIASSMPALQRFLKMREKHWEKGSVANPSIKKVDLLECMAKEPFDKLFHEGALIGCFLCQMYKVGYKF